MKYIEAIFKILKYSLNDIVYLVKLPFKLVRLLGRAVFYRKAKPRRRFKHYNPSKNRRYNYTKGVAYNKRQRRWTDVIFSEKLDDDGFAIVDDNPDDKSGLNHKHDNYQSQIDMLARKINELCLTDEAYNKQFNRLESRVTELFKTDISTDKQLDKLEAKVKSIDETDCSNYFNEKIEALEKANKTYINCFNTSESSHLLYLVNELEAKVETLNNDITTWMNLTVDNRAKVDEILSENSKLTFKPLTKEEEVSLEIAKGECKWDDEVRDYPDEPDFQAEKKAMDKQIADVKKRDEKWELTKMQEESFNDISMRGDIPDILDD